MTRSGGNTKSFKSGRIEKPSVGLLPNTAAVSKSMSVAIVHFKVHMLTGTVVPLELLAKYY